MKLRTVLAATALAAVALTAGSPAFAAPVIIDAPDATPEVTTIDGATPDVTTIEGAQVQSVELLRCRPKVMPGQAIKPCETVAE